MHIAEPIKRSIVLLNSDFIFSLSNDTESGSNQRLHTTATTAVPASPVTAAAADATYIFLVTHAIIENTAMIAIVLNAIDIPEISILSFRWNSPSNTSAIPSNIFKIHIVIMSINPAASAFPLTT